MVNKSAIKSINDAKEAKYNDKKLTDLEKTIFDNPLLLLSDDNKLHI